MCSWRHWQNREVRANAYDLTLLPILFLCSAQMYMSMVLHLVFLFPYRIWRLHKTNTWTIHFYLMNNLYSIQIGYISISLLLSEQDEKKWIYFHKQSINNRICRCVNGISIKISFITPHSCMCVCFWASTSSKYTFNLNSQNTFHFDKLRFGFMQTHKHRRHTVLR